MTRDHHVTLTCAINLAGDLAAMGEHEAESLKADTLQRYIRVLGPGHPDVDVAEQRRRLDFDFDPPVL
ncbi:tetratricopeptide repeat protein [Nonomuraea sp. PA05]|uniref:tetratricopeptide repeat protein n=1 Tax=Nonomuraea sp. PA05 TaxID=2604466 RepID=UPI0039837B08